MGWLILKALSLLVAAWLIVHCGSGPPSPLTFATRNGYRISARLMKPARST